MNHAYRILLGLTALAVVTSLSSAQLSLDDVLPGISGGGRRSGAGGGRYGTGGYDSRRLRDLTDIDNREGVAIWDNDPNFKSDVFTFVRLQYSSIPGAPPSEDTRWLIDYPSSELNFSFRLAQMTSMKVDPIPRHLKITDAELFNYPFVYMMEVGRLTFTNEEIVALRKYLLNGGFLLVDDHWGLDEQANFAYEMRRVFPERRLVELDLDHPIFHTVFDLKAKPQIPSIYVWSPRQPDLGAVG